MCGVCTRSHLTCSPVLYDAAMILALLFFFRVASIAMEKTIAIACVHNRIYYAVRPHQNRLSTK